MCVSALVETDRLKIAALLGLSQIEEQRSMPPDLDDQDLPRRIEAHALAWVVRQAAGSRLVVERMRFNPYVVRLGHITGDMWAGSLLSANHGLLVLKVFSEWVNVDLLVRLGLINTHEAHCAFNRYAQSYAPAPRSASNRLVLANLTPPASWLVPVLFDAAQASDEQAPAADFREFVTISEDPPSWLRSAGATSVPVNLSLEAALEWLATEPEPTEAREEAEVVDAEEILAGSNPSSLTFSLYKAAT